MATEPKVRVGHCSPDAPEVDIHIDGDRIVDNVPFGKLSDYSSLSAGTHSLRVVPAGGDDAVIEADVELAEDTAYTVLATGMLEDIEPTILTDDPGSVPSGNAHVRFVHASPDAPRVSIAVKGGDELISDIGFREASEYMPVDAGSYDLEVRPAGADDVVLSLADTSLGGGSAFTAIAIGLVEDDSLDALLAEDAAMPLEADD
jgi:hypothetical protein